MTKKQLLLKRRMLWVILISGVGFLYPFESTTVPSKAILVVTRDWKPIKGAVVRQSWQNYSLESVGHEDDLLTDETGRVVFPRRTIRASMVRRIVHPILNILRQGVHASFGAKTDVFSLPNTSEKPVGNETAQAQPGDIVLRLQ